MKKMLGIMLGFCITFQAHTMFRPWFDYKKSIARTEKLKDRAFLLANKNQNNLPLRTYCDSIKNITIDASNYSKISADCKTFLFVGNTHVFERLQGSSSSNGLSNFSLINPWSWNIPQRSAATMQEVQEIACDTSASFKFSDSIVVAGSLLVADSLVRRNSDSLALTLLSMPLYAIVPLTAVWLKKTRFDMHGILKNNGDFLSKQNTQLAYQQELSGQQIERLASGNADLNRDIQLLRDQNTQLANEYSVSRQDIERLAAEQHHLSQSIELLRARNNSLEQDNLDLQQKEFMKSKFTSALNEINAMQNSEGVQASLRRKTVERNSEDVSSMNQRTTVSSGETNSQQTVIRKEFSVYSMIMRPLNGAATLAQRQVSQPPVNSESKEFDRSSVSPRDEISCNFKQNNPGEKNSHTKFSIPVVHYPRLKPGQNFISRGLPGKLHEVEQSSVKTTTDECLTARILRGEISSSKNMANGARIASKLLKNL